MDTLTNQEFLYRENPVAYDGTGTITSIKGNTVSFNQLVQNGNFADTSGWSATRGSINVSGSNVCLYTITELSTAVQNNRIVTSVELTTGHKYYISGYIKSPKNTIGTIGFIQLNYIPTTNLSANVLTHIHSVYTSNDTGTYNYVMGISSSGMSLSDVVEFSNAMLLDLTLMGIDNLTTTAEVEEWLSSHIGVLPYYDYTQGTLIPFNGTGLKTTGKNLLDTTNSTISGLNMWFYGNNSTYKFFKAGTYTFSYSGNSNNKVVIYLRNSNGVNKSIVPNTTTVGTFTILDDGYYGFFAQNTDGISESDCYNPQIEIGEEATTYEPYTSNTLSLPISTYFPSGMKDCTQSSPCYDEMNLTSGKGYERVEMVDLGSLGWVSGFGGYYTRISTYKTHESSETLPPLMTPLYRACQYNQLNDNDKVITSVWNGIGYTYNGLIVIKDTSYTDATAFKTAMSGQYLYYEKATPTEFDISSDRTYPVWNGGTEQILPINDSTPDTAPILCDIDYRGLIPVNAEDRPDGSGMITGTGNYRYHDIVTLTATPTDEIYRFLRWEDENGDTLSTDATYSFEIGE